MYRLWQELGAAREWRIFDHDLFCRIEGEDGQVFTVYTDIDRLSAHMKELAPEDTAVIDELAQGLHHITRISMKADKPAELATIIDRIKMIGTMLPHAGFFRKWGRLSLQEFAARFKNDFVRRALLLLFDMPDFPMMAFLFTFGWLHNREAGYPIGGSLQFARSIEKRYLELGGEIRYKSPVAKILVESGKALGVRLADGSQQRADFVISAADGHTTIFDLLEGKYCNDTVRGYYKNMLPFPPLVFVGLGVAMNFADVQPSVAGISIPLPNPITIAGKEERRLSVRILSYAPTLAPEGKNVLTVMFTTDYDYWKRLKDDPERYKAEKKAIADKVVEALSRRFPDLADKVEMVDVATPATFERYTGNWRGSFEGWLVTRKTMMMRMKKTLPCLSNFYMAGQWVSPGGGLPTGAIEGRNVMQIICHKDGKAFNTSVP
jgi:phytoene dehydrogenase-like protein